MIKIMKTKRLSLIFIMLILTIFCGGCLSSEEKAEGKKNIVEAKPHIKQYVKDNYGRGSKISDYSYVTWTRIDSTVASRDVGISSNVTAKVQVENDEFTLMYNISTGEYRSDEYKSNLEPELLRMFREDLGFTGTVACEVSFGDEILDIDGLLPVDLQPSNLTELNENMDLGLDILVYCIDGDWDDYSLRGEDISNTLEAMLLEEKYINFYVLNIYDTEKYDELISQNNSFWFTSSHIVEFDSSGVILPEPSYIGKYASAAYYIHGTKDDLRVYSINEESIHTN